MSQALIVTVLNWLATSLTIEEGIRSITRDSFKNISDSDIPHLSEVIDYRKVPDDIEIYVCEADKYIAQHHYGLHDTILTSKYREHFIKTFYRTHPDCKLYKSIADYYLNQYLDRLEIALKKGKSFYDLFIGKTIIDTQEAVEKIRDDVYSIKSDGLQTFHVLEKIEKNQIVLLENQETILNNQYKDGANNTEGQIDKTDLKKIVQSIDVIQDIGNIGLSTLDIGEFIGREKELSIIDERIEKGINPIIISGFGGIGKTELVIEYGRRKSSSHKVIFVRFKNSFRKTVTDSILDSLPAYSKYIQYGVLKPEEQIYEEIFHELKKIGRNTILIIDNVDDDRKTIDEMLDDTFWKLCELPMQIVITTRYQSDLSMIPVDSLESEALYQLISRYISIPKEEMDCLIEFVQGHTLAVDLMAKTLKYSIPRISVYELIDSLRKEADTFFQYPRISSKKDRNLQKKTIEGHLNALFRINNLSDQERQCLSYTLAIPPSGVSLELFIGITASCSEIVFSLIEKGWIQTDSQGVLLHPHPLIDAILINNILWKEFLISFIDNVDACAESYCGNDEGKIYAVEELMIYVQERFGISNNHTLFKWGLSEIIHILPHMEKSALAKTPWRFCRYVMENKSSFYQADRVKKEERNTKLNELRLLEKTKDILAFLYLYYWADEFHAKRYVELLKKNEEKHLIKKKKNGYYINTDMCSITEVGIKNANSPPNVFDIEDIIIWRNRLDSDHWNLSRCYRELGDYKKAIEEEHNVLQLLLSCGPSDENSRLLIDERIYLGNLYIESKQYTKAFSLLSELELEDDNATVLNNIAWLYAYGYGIPQNYSLAIHYWERAAIEVSKSGGISCRHLGRLYLGVHPSGSSFKEIDAIKAVQYLEKAKARGCNNVDDLIEKAKLLIQGNNC